MSSSDVIVKEKENTIYRSIFSWTVADFLERSSRVTKGTEIKFVSPSFETWWQDKFVITLIYIHDAYGKLLIHAIPKLEVVGESIYEKIDENSKLLHISAMNKSGQKVNIFKGPPDSKQPRIYFNYQNWFSLKLRIKIMIVLDAYAFSCLNQPLAVIFEEQFQNLEENEHLFDVIIRVGETQLKANKLILSAVSPVFTAMFRNQFKESKINVVDIKNFDLDTVKSFLTFVYTSKRPEFKDLASAANLYCMSQEYEVPVLKNICKTYIKSDKECIEKFLDIFALMKV